MTVADNTSRNQYTATSGQTVFAYTFEIVDKDDIVVLKNGTTLSEGTDYTVSNVGNDNGGNVTLTSGATAGDILTLYRDMPYARTQNYTNSGDFLASEVNSDFDNLWLAGEQTNRSFSQSIRKPITDSDSISMELPEAADRTNSFLTFDSTGAVSTSPLSSALSPSIIVRQQFTGNGSTTVFTLSADPGSPAGVVIYIDGVYQEEGTYSVSGSTVTFTEAPPTNASIEVVSYKTTAVGTTDANSVTYLPAGTGAVQTTVQTKLRESVSAQDFGAVGDGVTDDTAAIQAALNAVREIANANTEEIDVGVVKLKPNTIYKISSDLTIPKRITLEAKGVKILLDADVSIIFDQDAHFCADRNTQVIMATGHTTSAFKKNATTGGMHITGWPLIKSVDPAARTGASVGNIAVNMTRVKAGLIEVKVEECGTPIYIDAQAVSDTCYYNEICLHARAFNYGIYSTGEYSNGNTFRIRRLSDGYRAINYIPGTSSIAGSGNNFYGGFAENITNVGVSLEDASQNNFYGWTFEGTGSPTAAINLAGAGADNKFFGVEAGDQFASSTKVIIQSSGTLRTTFIGSRYTNLIDVSGAINAVDATGSTINGSAVSGVFTNVTGTTTSVNVDTNDHVAINHSSATNFTDFAVTSNIRGPRLLYVYFASGNTTLKHATGNIRLSSGGDETPAAGDVYQFYRPGAPHSTNWFGKQLYP